MPETATDQPVLEIVGLAAGGRGVARPEDGPVWLVRGALPGDLVQARALKRRERIVEGAVERLVRPSEARRDAVCPIQRRCGGCPWMVLDDDAQAVWKRRLVEDALSRIGGFEVEVEPLVRGERLIGYRNRIELSVIAGREGGLRTAMHAVDGGTLHVGACAVQHPDADALLGALNDELATVDPGELEPSSWRIGLRRSDTDGRLLLVVQDDGRAIPGLDGLAERLEARCPALAGTVRLSRRRSARGGASVRVVRGRGWLRERIDGFDVRVPAASFLQVNGETGRRLLELVAERAGHVRDRTVIDLYGGFGLYGLALARRGARVIVCEADVEAVRAGREAARRAGLRTIEHVHADAGRWLAARADVPSPDVIVANPPRRGFAPRVRAALSAGRARRLIVVSCDPGTLARDLRAMCSGGYRLTRVTPVDLFPQTAHVEAVAVLEREPSTGDVA